jgi:hypothetical protein
MKRVDVLKAAPLSLLAACSNPSDLFTAPSGLSPAGVVPDKGCENLKPFWQWFPSYAQAAWYKPVQGKLGGCHFDCIGLVGLELSHKFPDMPPITIYFWARTGDCWTPKKNCGYGSITLESWNDKRWSKKASSSSFGSTGSVAARPAARYICPTARPSTATSTARRRPSL